MPDQSALERLQSVVSPCGWRGRLLTDKNVSRSRPAADIARSRKRPLKLPMGKLSPSAKVACASYAGGPRIPPDQAAPSRADPGVSKDRRGLWYGRHRTREVLPTTPAG